MSDQEKEKAQAVATPAETPPAEMPDALLNLVPSMGPPPVVPPAVDEFTPDDGCAAPSGGRSSC